MMVWPQVLEVVRLYPAFEIIANHCHKRLCRDCPVYAVCESMVSLSGHTMEDIALEFLEFISGELAETCGIEEGVI